MDVPQHSSKVKLAVNNGIDRAFFQNIGVCKMWRNIGNAGFITYFASIRLFWFEYLSAKCNLPMDLTQKIEINDW